MIAKLEGTLGSVEDGFVIVMVGGIGFKVTVSSFVLGKLAGQNQVSLYTHTYVREDTLSLYGFLSMDELRMFELLISVSGVGPKAALSILSLADPIAIKTAILNHDASILTKVSGVGKKTAERVILDLENKVGKIAEGVRTEAMADSEVLDALLALGYGAGEAREALQGIPNDLNDTSAKVRWILQHLGRKR
ncbi:MAG: Holliday junction branch migration protein RuvA [Candidatus Moraniibacteriota bacterium]